MFTCSFARLDPIVFDTVSKSRPAPKVDQDLASIGCYASRNRNSVKYPG